ncbi:MAG: hypothetical protein AUJ57_04225 [Zetaproteobacteria bacterium CG1_02_53_45]|nr:MAG: hypothetical protein AUJ57_04225 [Zetaproteobacteria bacterium CG1_02_53_45]
MMQDREPEWEQVALYRHAIGIWININRGALIRHFHVPHPAGCLMQSKSALLQICLSPLSLPLTIIARVAPPYDEM